jgi:hypothetical protein
MSGLSKELVERCQTIFLNCGEFESDLSLRSLFLTDELSPFRYGIPSALAKIQRVNNCLDYLLGKHLKNGRSVLPLFVEILQGRYSHEDSLYDELENLRRDLVRDLSRKRMQLFRKRIYICNELNIEPDQQVADYFCQFFTAHQIMAFSDNSNHNDEAWFRKINDEIQNSDFLILLLSEQAASSEMVQSLVREAYEYRKDQGYPQIIRVNIGELSFPIPFEEFLQPILEIGWQNQNNTELISREVLNYINGYSPYQNEFKRFPQDFGGSILQDKQVGTSEPRMFPPFPDMGSKFLEIMASPGGTMKLHDQFYIDRYADTELKSQILIPGNVITIRGSRQSGKSSLLVRGAHYASQRDAKIINVDIQSVDREILEHRNIFLQFLGDFIIRKLALEHAEVEQSWQSSLGAQTSLTNLMGDYVLPGCDSQIVLAFDEVDRLLQTDFHSEFFGLIRSWHNKSAYDKEWERLNTVLVISTEPYLLISDVHQSPFNVGSKVYLEDFNFQQISELNRRHNSVLPEHILPDFVDLFNGHPYLSRQALYVLVTGKMSWNELTRIAPLDDGPFGDHLRHYLWILNEKNDLRTAFSRIVHHKPCSNEMALFRLERAGLVRKLNGKSYGCRCRLYEIYFKNRI